MSSILITGASSEIGLGLVKKLAENTDHHLLCHCHRNSSALEELARNSGAQISILPGDFSTTEDIQDWVKLVAKLDPCPSSLFFLAAPPLKLLRFRENFPAEYEIQFRVQVTSAAEIMRTFLPEMVKAKRGNIVFLLSTVVNGNAPGAMAPYVVAKSALHGLFRASSSEYKNKGLRFHALAPGLIRTKYIADFPPRLLEIEAELSKLGRLLEVEDIVPPLCRFLEDETLPSGEVHAL